MSNIGTKNDTDIARGYAASLVLPDNGVWKAYITTGENSSSSNLNDKTWEYDFATGVWSRKTPFSEGGSRRTTKERAVAWSFINLKRGFIGMGITTGGGITGTGFTALNDMAEWFPANTENAAD